MNSKVARLFERLQNDFLQLLSELDNVKSEQLEISPAKGIWSVTQVMYHLNSAESLSVLYVNKKRLGASQLKRTGIEAQLRLLYAGIAFYVPFKYRAPAFLGDMPEHVAYEEIKTSWLKTRSDLAALLESLTDDELHKPIFRQPFFGRWNIFQMLGFMQIHFNRHRKQMKARLKEKEE
jgi:hypothetical protein